MKKTAWLLVLAAGVLLSGCGGGGGGGGASTGGGLDSAAPAVAINTSNAKTVAASAIDAAQNMAAAQSSTLVTGVQVQVAGSVAGSLAFAQAIQAMARLASSPTPMAALPAGVTVNRTVPCTSGGSLTVAGSVANVDQLSTGDNVSFSASNCRETVDGQAATLNGTMSLQVVSGAVIDATPYRAVLQVKLDNFSVQAGSMTSTGNGDMRIDLTVAATGSESFVISGDSLASRVTVGSTTRTTTLKSYSQTLAITGSAASGSLSATVVVDNPRVASVAATFVLSTVSPIIWSTASNLATSGSLKLVGASGSQLLLAIGPGGVATIQVDANGDGSYEATVNSSATELAGLL